MRGALCLRLMTPVLVGCLGGGDDPDTPVNDEATASSWRLDRTLDDRFQFLPHGMVLALCDKLSDGRISAWEREHVLRALDEDEVLTGGQKERVSDLVDGWYQRDAGGGP